VMADASRQVIVLTDSSKFGRKGFNQVLSLDKIHTVITDEGAPEEALIELRKQGKTVIVA